jgi:hypothetical protein
MWHEWGRYRLLVGKPEGKRLLGKPKRRWVDNIRLDLGEVGWGDVVWSGLAQDRNRWRASLHLPVRKERIVKTSVSRAGVLVGI